MSLYEAEKILNEADSCLFIVVCKNNDINACEIIPACDRFMKINGFCECGMDASFIHNHKDLCRECLTKLKQVSLD